MIKGIKLMTGEDLLADAELFNGVYTLTNPVRLAMIPPQNGQTQPSVGFAPFPTFGLQSSKNIIQVSGGSVSYEYIPDEEMEQQYNKVFGSGIVLPTKKLLVG